MQALTVVQMLGGTEADPVVFILGQMGEIMEKQVVWGAD